MYSWYKERRNYRDLQMLGFLNRHPELMTKSCHKEIHKEGYPARFLQNDKVQDVRATITWDGPELLP